ncbi:MAG TPA: GNAT family N-acetyltransferase [Polyangia bacterium]|nr:GNAT family N-acetyltransferase [Polyangia bacterium]
MIRPAREDDLPGLLALHRRVFGRALSAQERRWKLADQPSPVPNVWVAEVDGRVVFQFAGIPVRVQHRGRQRWAMQSVDTMADPEHRRRGLLTETALLTFEQWKRAGVAFVFGLPNQNWRSRLTALGFVALGEARWWVRWLSPLRRLAGTVTLLDDPAPIDGLWAGTADEGLVKDAAWYRWRYLAAPRPFQLIGAHGAGRLAGVAAFRCDGASAIVAEVQTAGLDTARDLLKAACRAAAAGGARRAALLVHSGTQLEQAALAAGFVPRPHSFPIVAADLAGGLPRAALFQGGDFDVV